MLLVFCKELWLYDSDVYSFLALLAGFKNIPKNISKILP